METLDVRISKINKNIDELEVKKLVREYTPFILKTVSGVIKRYVQIENDEEFSVGIMAFVEAIERYEIENGKFLTFARIVIESRVKNYLKKENKYNDISLEVCEGPLKEAESVDEEEAQLADEIKVFEEKLKYFNINIEKLLKLSPKHKDTRKNVVELANKISTNKNIIEHLYLKKRFPITLISKEYNISIKVIKKNKIFITSIIVIITENLRMIKEWIKID